MRWLGGRNSNTVELEELGTFDDMPGGPGGTKLKLLFPVDRDISGP